MWRNSASQWPDQHKALQLPYHQSWSQWTSQTQSSICANRQPRTRCCPTWWVSYGQTLWQQRATQSEPQELCSLVLLPALPCTSPVTWRNGKRASHLLLKLFELPFLREHSGVFFHLSAHQALHCCIILLHYPLNPTCFMPMPVAFLSVIAAEATAVHHSLGSTIISEALADAGAQYCRAGLEFWPDLY